MFLSPDVPLTVSAVPLAYGSAGTAQTMRAIRDMIEAGKRDADVIRAATAVIYTTPEKFEAAEACAVFDYVRDHVRYVRDVAGVETLSHPRITLARLAGDCDDQVALLGAMLEAVGYPVRLVVAAYQAPQAWEHVYLQVFAGGQWIDCDPTEREVMGWAPPGAVSIWLEGES
jgi:transglutaminase-like putative cysteine protease